MKDNQLLSYSDGDLYFGIKKVKISELIKDYQRPIYIYDLDFISQQVNLYKNSLPLGAKIFYAVKANANPNILRHLKSLGINVDVVSIGEIKCALEAGFNPKQIMFSGVGKTVNEIEFAIDQEIFQINVESLSELKRIINISQKLNKKIDVAVRINPDISVDTHPYISTGLKENKFGLEVNQLDQFAEMLTQQKHVTWTGLSIHLGSQIFDVEPMKLALDALIVKIKEFGQIFKSLNRVDLGGGLGIDYHRFDFEKEKITLKTYGDMIKEKLAGTHYELLVEPGRFIVGHSGILITQIQYIKNNQHKSFVVVDSGMNHLLRPSLYQAHHQIWPTKKQNKPGIICDIVGPICETSDFFARNYHLDFCIEGDFLAICDVGAYGYSMASRYNQTDLPLEICLA